MPGRSVADIAVTITTIMKDIQIPTAGVALSGCPDIHAVSKRRKPGVREKVVRRKLPLVSEMDEYLASLAKKEGYGKIRYVLQEGKWKTGIIPAKDAGTDM